MFGWQKVRRYLLGLFAIGIGLTTVGICLTIWSGMEEARILYVPSLLSIIGGVIYMLGKRLLWLVLGIFSWFVGWVIFINSLMTWLHE